MDRAAATTAHPPEQPTQGDGQPSDYEGNEDADAELIRERVEYPPDETDEG